MTVCSTYLRRILARPWTLALTIAIPVLLALLGRADGGEARLRVALFDRDESELSRMVTDALEPIAVFVDIEYDRVEAGLIDGRIEYAIVIPGGLEEAILRGEEARLRTYSLEGVEMTAAIRAAADGVLSAAGTVARRTRGDREAFTRAMGRAENGRFAVRTETVRGERATLAESRIQGIARLIGILTLTMLFMTTIASFMFLQDIKTGVFHRSLAGPVSVRRYMIEANLAFFLATLLQGVAAALVIRAVFPDIAAHTVLMLLVILAAFSLVAVSFSLAVATVAKTVRRTQVTINFIAIPMAMLGGAFWPVEIMPEVLQRIGDFTPIRWTTSAAHAALSGAQFGAVLPHVGILLLFAVVFQCMGTWKKVDVAR